KSVRGYGAGYGAGTRRMYTSQYVVTVPGIRIMYTSQYVVTVPVTVPGLRRMYKSVRGYGDGYGAGLRRMYTSQYAVTVLGLRRMHVSTWLRCRLRCGTKKNVYKSVRGYGAGTKKNVYKSVRG